MLKFIKIFFVMICISANLFSQDDWTIIGEMKSPVSSAAPVVYNNKIYLIGGYSSDLQQEVDWIQEYNPINNTWKLVGSLSTERQGLVASLNGNNILAYGGSTLSEDISSSLESISIQNNFVSSVISSHQNFNRMYSAGYLVDSSLFIIGGFSNNLNNDKKKNSVTDILPYITEYSVPLDSFVYNYDSVYTDGIMPSMQMTELVGDEIYLFGGVYSGILQSISKFNIRTKHFEVLDTELLIPRAGGSAVYYSEFGKIFIIGGYHELNSALTSVEVFDIYNPENATISWEPLSFGRKNPTAVYFNGGIYVFGGEDINGNVVKEIEFMSSTPTSVLDEKTIPFEYDILKNNYPNPFNPETNIEFSIINSGRISLIVYSILGEKVIELMSENLDKGNYNVKWNGLNEKGLSVPSGIYIYQLRTNNSVITKKMTLLK